MLSMFTYVHFVQALFYKGLRDCDGCSFVVLWLDLAVGEHSEHIEHRVTYVGSDTPVPSSRLHPVQR